MYKNKFHNSKNQGSKEFYKDDPKAVNYKGYKIHKVSKVEFHVVKNNICINMLAGLNGAKSKIDQLLNPSYFVKTGKTLQNHTSVKSEEVGFFRVFDPQRRKQIEYNTVVFKTKEGIYFNAYGCILDIVRSEYINYSQSV